MSETNESFGAAALHRWQDPSRRQDAPWVTLAMFLSVREIDGKVRWNADESNVIVTSNGGRKKDDDDDDDGGR